MRIQPATNEIIAVTNVTFKKWSEQKKVEGNKGSQTLPVPTKVQKILDEYPSILKANFSKNPRHGVIHTIDTGSAKPCQAKCRPLLPGSPKAKEAERLILEMEKVGIMKRVPPGEPTTWSSALHLATKADGSLRPCGDYRPLNQLTEMDSFNLPNIRQFAAKLKGQQKFFKTSLLQIWEILTLLKL